MDILSDFARKTLPQREALLVGGRKNVEYVDIFDPRHYRNASLLVAKLHRRILGILTLALPPKANNGTTNVYVATEKSKIFIVETGIQNATTEPTTLSPKIRQIKRFWFLNP